MPQAKVKDLEDDANPNTLASRGRRARERAQRRSGSGRINSAAWYPEIVWLDGLGMRNAEIAKALHLSERRVSEIRSDGRKDGQAMVKVEPVPVMPADFSAETLAMTEFSGDGFALFYEWLYKRPLPDHCRDWVQEFCDFRNLMLNVPPRHMKSSVFSVAVPIWLICRNRDEQILLISKTGKLARQWINDIAYELEFNQELVETFGRFAPERKGESPWRPGEGVLQVLGRSRTARQAQFSFQARGMEQQVLGMEATIVIVDDPTDSKTAKSDIAHEEEMRKLHEEVLSRVEARTVSEAAGRVVIVGQRVHFRDMYGELSRQVWQRGPKKGERLFEVITHPAVIQWPDETPDGEAEVLWPDKWTFDELMLVYERVGGHANFECYYQQNPMPEDEVAFRPEWWEGCRDYDRAALHGVRNEQDHDHDFIPMTRVLSIDPSPKRFNGLVVADVAYTGEHFAAAIIEAKHWVGGLRSIIEEIERCSRQYALDYFILEQSTFTGWLYEDPYFQSIRDRFRVIGHNTGRNKADPERGVESLAGDVEFGRIRLPYGDPLGREMSRAVEDEANVFPFGDHDDILMALWFIKWNWRRLVPLRDLVTTFRGKQQTPWGVFKRRNDPGDVVARFRKQRAERAKRAASETMGV